MQRKGMDGEIDRDEIEKNGKAKLEKGGKGGKGGMDWEDGKGS